LTSAICKGGKSESVRTKGRDVTEKGGEGEGGKKWEDGKKGRKMGERRDTEETQTYVTDHVESGLGESVVLTGEDRLKRLNGVLKGDEATLETSEDFSHRERLRHETLDLTGTLDLMGGKGAERGGGGEGGKKKRKNKKKRKKTATGSVRRRRTAERGQTHGKLVGLGKLIHSKNGNDVLETLVVLEELLGSEGNVVVLLTDDTGVEHTRLGVEGVDGGVDTELGDTTTEGRGSVQVGEGGGGGGVSQVVSGDVDGLDTGDGSLLGGAVARKGGKGEERASISLNWREKGVGENVRDTLLHASHVGRESGLVSDSGGDTTEKGGNLGTGWRRRKSQFRR
jgi:hypothetical protein